MPRQARRNSRYVDDSSSSRAYKGRRRSLRAVERGDRVLAVTETIGTVPGVETAVWDRRKLAGGSSAERADLDARVDRVCARLGEGHQSLLPYTRGGINRGSGAKGLKRIAKSMGLAVSSHHRREQLLNAVCALKAGGKGQYELRAAASKADYQRYTNDARWRQLHDAYKAARAAVTAARGAMATAEKSLREHEGRLEAVAPVPVAASDAAVDLSDMLDDIDAPDFGRGGASTVPTDQDDVLDLPDWLDDDASMRDLQQWVESLPVRGDDAATAPPAVKLPAFPPQEPPRRQ